MSFVISKKDRDAIVKMGQRIDEGMAFTGEKIKVAGKRDIELTEAKQIVGGDINREDTEFAKTQMIKIAVKDKKITKRDLDEYLKILIDMIDRKTIFEKSAKETFNNISDLLNQRFPDLDLIEDRKLLLQSIQVAEIARIDIDRSIDLMNGAFDEVGDIELAFHTVLGNLMNLKEEKPKKEEKSKDKEKPKEEEKLKEDIAAGQSGVGTQATINQESALVEAAQIAQQNELLKSMILEQNLNMDILADDITFEEHLAITKRRLDESARLQLDEFQIGDSALEMQQAHRTLDQQLNLNLQFGIPLI